MSRAFVKEDDAAGGPDIPERHQSANPVLITPNGFAELERRFQALQEDHVRIAAAGPDATEALRSIERDLRYLRSRIERAIVIHAADAKPNQVSFGATVTVRRDDDSTESFTLVGEDEADARNSRVSWTSPLGRALLGVGPGDTVTWARPAGDVDLTVIRFDYHALATRDR
ncbi:MAG: transcription elongation factor GreAB [Alphaproteobacteria bacterium]|nr:transcription elongation factor GreAB [Alphaproteobacteria bacterium]